MPNHLVRSLTEELIHIQNEMNACMTEMDAGIDYDYNQELYDDLVNRQNMVRLNLEITTNFYKFAESQRKEG
jgi:hypothetical protein